MGVSFHTSANHKCASAHLEMACDAQGGEKIVFCLSYHVSVAGHVLQVTTLENKLVNISPVPGGLQ